jgi:tyrosine-protein kinase Etk/Wzc
MKESRTPEPTIFSDNKQFLLSVLSIKYYYIAIIFLFILIAFIYNRYTSVVYEVTATISPIKNETSSLLSSNELFSGLQAFRMNNNIENEINNLKSFSLVSSTINTLNFEVGYFVEKKKLFKETIDLYGRSPIIVNLDKSHVQPVDYKFYIYILNESSYRLKSFQEHVPLYNYLDNRIISKENTILVDTICKFNETITNKNFKFSVTINNDLKSEFSKEKVYYFEFYNLDYLAKDYLRRINISRTTPSSSILTVQFSGKNLSKVLTFLNSYLGSYFEESLTKKNKIAVSTINFIDSQLAEISDSLVSSESKLRNYRSVHQVMNLSYQGQQSYDRLQQIDIERSNLQAQERYYNYLLDYFKKNSDMSGVTPPSAMNVVDPTMNQLIGELVALNTDRSNILNNNAEKNLFLGQIENKIEIKKRTIIENATNNLNTLSLSINELNYRADKLSKEISNMPKTELNMVGIQRQYNVSDAIYTYLLQKRSEAAIAMASNYPDFEILEPAREVTSQIVTPKAKTNFLLALFLGFLLPTLFIIVRELLNNKVQSVLYIEHLFNRSVLGIIPHSDFKSESVVTEYPGSSISEAFRIIRSNLFLKLKDNPNKVILVSSSQPQDGKSFFSYNLAFSIATVGYKTIIIDGDLHRPTLHSKFNSDYNSGLSNYMTENLPIDDIIYKTTLENLGFIPSGPILPNASELIQAGKLDDLIDTLTKKYDYVLIDTTPMGIVSDAILFSKYASEIVLVCRNNYTRKDVLANVIDNLNMHKLDKYDIIFNDQRLKESTYGQYTSYYKNPKKS